MKNQKNKNFQDFVKIIISKKKINEKKLGNTTKSGLFKI